MHREVYERQPGQVIVPLLLFLDGQIVSDNWHEIRKRIVENR